VFSFRGRPLPRFGAGPVASFAADAGAEDVERAAADFAGGLSATFWTTSSIFFSVTLISRFSEGRFKFAASKFFFAISLLLYIFK
jgi:hypothetical protein